MKHSWQLYAASNADREVTRCLICLSIWLSFVFYSELYSGLSGPDMVFYLYSSIKLPLRKWWILTTGTTVPTQGKWPTGRVAPKGMFLTLVRCTLRVRFHWYLHCDKLIFSVEKAKLCSSSCNWPSKKKFYWCTVRVVFRCWNAL